MKYKILQLDEHGKISFTKEELEKLLDEVYEEGRRDGYGWRYAPYITYTGTTIPNEYITSPYTKTIKIGDNFNESGYYTGVPVNTVNKTE